MTIPTNAIIQAIAGSVSIALCVMLLKFRVRSIRYFSACEPLQCELDDRTRDSIPDMIADAKEAPVKRARELAEAEGQIAKIKAGEPWIQE